MVLGPRGMAFSYGRSTPVTCAGSGENAGRISTSKHEKYFADSEVRTDPEPQSAFLSTNPPPGCGLVNNNALLLAQSVHSPALRRLAGVPRP